MKNTNHALNATLPERAEMNHTEQNAIIRRGRRLNVSGLLDLLASHPADAQ